jgi:hypothetical protein
MKEVTRLCRFEKYKMEEMETSDLLIDFIMILVAK